jgi:hypothetical protein
LNLREIFVRPVRPSETQLYQDLMQQHHYLGALPKIGETLWYVAIWREHWVALVSFSAAAWKCAARDRWIGWDFRHQYDRLQLLVNNSRFLVLPAFHIPNLASRVLGLCQRRLRHDWQQRFGHPVLLMETFVDPQRCRGTVYRAANWLYVGNTKGFRRARQGYTQTAQTPKMVFLKPLQADAQALLSRALLEPSYRTGEPKIMLSAQHMQSLPYFFADIPDPRRGQGRRHQLRTVLALSAAAALCGMQGYKAMHDWTKGLGQKARERFGCRRENGRYVIPSLYVLRDVLVRVEPVHLDRALQRWNEAYATEDETLAIDGKTMRNAIDDEGHQVHIMSAVGHTTKTCYTQKKSVPCP